MGVPPVLSARDLDGADGALHLGFENSLDGPALPATSPARRQELAERAEREPRVMAHCHGEHAPTMCLILTPAFLDGRAHLRAAPLANALRANRTRVTALTRDHAGPPNGARFGPLADDQLGAAASRYATLRSARRRNLFLSQSPSQSDHVEGTLPLGLWCCNHHRPASSTHGGRVKARVSLPPSLNAGLVFPVSEVTRPSSRWCQR